MEWNEERAKKIIKKHKKRFSLKLAFQIIRLSVALLILYMIYMLIIGNVYQAGNFGGRTAYYQRLAIDWTYPGFSGDFGPSYNEVTPFLTKEIEMALLKRIGKEDFVVSKVKLTDPLIGQAHKVIEKTYPYNALETRFSFYLPYQPGTDRKTEGNENPAVWDTLERVHEGNVANLAFSTDEYHSPEEIIKMLEPFDLDILWMPLNTGEQVEFSEGSFGYSGSTVNIDFPFGLAGGRIANEDFKGERSMRELDQTTVAESKEVMLQNMETMLNTDKELAEDLLQTSYLQERYDYIKENGFQAYGAVVTGPVKELLKLKDVNGIHSARLGDITHWNWYE